MSIDATEKVEQGVEESNMIVKSTDNLSTLDTIVTAEEGQKFLSNMGAGKRQILPFQSLQNM